MDLKIYKSVVRYFYVVNNQSELSEKERGVSATTDIPSEDCTALQHGTNKNNSCLSIREV